MSDSATSQEKGWPMIAKAFALDSVNHGNSVDEQVAVFVTFHPLPGPRIRPSTGLDRRPIPGETQARF
jgi:hypothetical protein